MGETSKARDRREREGFFGKYLSGRGIDIGCGNDKVLPDADAYDFFQPPYNGDATYMEGVEDESYDWVYSSHCLEHLDSPRVALRNWWRIVKPGGNLVVVVPHRDLYEKKKELPSRWNLEHRSFYVENRHELPDTLGLEQIVEETLRDYEVLLLRTCADGHTITDPERHSDGEYSIEMVLKKKGP